MYPKHGVPPTSLLNKKRKEFISNNSPFIIKKIFISNNYNNNLHNNNNNNKNNIIRKRKLKHRQPFLDTKEEEFGISLIILNYKNIRLMNCEQKKVGVLKENADRKLKKELRLMEINSDNNSKQQSKPVSTFISASVSSPFSNSHQKTKPVAVITATTSLTSLTYTPSRRFASPVIRPSSPATKFVPITSNNKSSSVSPSASSSMPVIKSVSTTTSIPKPISISDSTNKISIKPSVQTKTHIKIFYKIIQQLLKKIIALVQKILIHHISFTNTIIVALNRMLKTMMNLKLQLVKN
jgi:hypothetical protein